VYYSIDPTNPTFGLQSPVNPRVRPPQAGGAFTDVSLDPAVAAQQMAAEAVAQQVAGVGAGSNYRDLRAARKAGVDPALIRTVGVGPATQAQALFSSTGSSAQQATQAARAAGTQAAGKTGTALRAAGGLLGRVPTGALAGGGAILAGVPALMQGDVAGAAGSSGGALVGGLLGAPLGPLGVAAGSFVGSMVGGGVVNATKAALEKTPQAVSIPTPFGDLPLNASAQQLKYMQQLGELGETQYRSALGTRTSALIDLNKQISDQDYLNRQRDFPLMQAEQNADLARSQALINTQNNAYMQQMVLGTAGNMMLDAQRERGALMRQAIATNPYVTALAAPNVSIG
jgi:hypothetical protein